MPGMPGTFLICANELRIMTSPRHSIKRTSKKTHDSSTLPMDNVHFKNVVNVLLHDRFFTLQRLNLPISNLTDLLPFAAATLLFQMVSSDVTASCVVGFSPFKSDRVFCDFSGSETLRGSWLICWAK